MDHSELSVINRTTYLNDAVIFDAYPTIVEEPSRIRWRAWPCEYAIELRPYPITKTNPASVWIDEHAWFDGAKWHLTTARPRLLMNNTRAAWAKPTRAEALQGLVIRTAKWGKHLSNDIQKARDRAKLIEHLLPEHAHLLKGSIP
jgi:hypothetical protein